MSEIVPKKWYDRPEKWANLLGLAAIGTIAFIYLDAVLPIVQNVLRMAFQSAIYAAGTGIIVSIMVWVITSKDLHKIAWFGYETLMRHLASLVVNIDPIAIMKSYRKSLRESLKEMKTSLGNLTGQQKRLEDKIRQTNAAIETNMLLANQARKKQNQEGMKNALKLYSRKSQRKEESSITYQGLLNRVKTHVALSKKIVEASECMILDIDDTIEEETEKRAMIRESHKLMSASKRLLAANEQREMYDMALESVTNDYFSKLGEIEQFMEDSQHFVNTMDLQNGVYEEEALSRLEAWDKRSESLLSGGSGKTKYRIEKDPAEVEENPETESPAFSSLFKNLD
jgi:DNA primase